MFASISITMLYVEKVSIFMVSVMVKIYESRFPPSPNLDKVTVSFEK